MPNCLLFIKSQTATRDAGNQARVDKLNANPAGKMLLNDALLPGVLAACDGIRSETGCVSSGEAVRGEKDCSAKASMQQNRMSENSSFQDMVKTDEAAELEKASRTALTKEQ